MKQIKKFLLVLVLKLPIIQVCLGQTQAYPLIQDTVYVASNQTAMLIFEYEVSLVDLGTSEYIAQKAGNKVLIRSAVPTPEMASLLIAFGDKIFSGFVAYSPLPDQPVYDYRHQLQSPKFDTERPLPYPGIGEDNQPSPIDTSRLYGTLHWMKIWHEADLRKKEEYPKASSGEVFAYVKPVKHDTALTYIPIRLENRSPIPFKVDFIGVKILEPAPKKGLGDIVKEPQPVLNLIPKVVKRYGNELAILAIPTYATTEKGWMEVHITEKQGTRSLLVKIRAKEKHFAKPVKDFFTLKWLRK